jgi:hypothetical protein
MDLLGFHRTFLDLMEFSGNSTSNNMDFNGINWGLMGINH